MSSSVFARPFTASAACLAAVCFFFGTFSATNLHAQATPVAAPFDFGTVAVGGTSTQDVMFNIQGGNYGTTYATAQGSSGKDFSVANTFCSGSKGTSVCKVSTNFTPKSPGVRYGAINITDTNGNIVGVGYIKGTGTAPQIGYISGNTVSVGYPAGQGVAVDPTGNVYTSYYNQVLKYTAGNFPNNTVINQDLHQVGAIAIDGAGNLYLTDQGGSSGRVIKLTLNNANGTYAETVLVPNAYFPSGIGVDPAGNIFYSDFSTMYKLTPTGANTYTSSVAIPNTGITGNANGITFDNSGTLLYTGTTANGSSAAVIKATLSGSTYTPSVLFTLPSQYYGEGIAVDAAGYIYVATELTDQLTRYTSTGTSPVILSTNRYQGIALDPSGNIYAAGSDGGNPNITEFTIATPPALSYATTNSGSTSSDSPKVVTVVNTGNATLNFTLPTFPATNPTTVPNFSYAGTCAREQYSSAMFTLAAGVTCTQQISFLPATGGALTANLVTTDNNLNVTNATQTEVLSGTAIGATTTTVTASPATSTTYGNNVTLTATVSPSAGAPGYVVFNDKGSAISGSVNTTGQTASFVVSSPAIGSHSYTAAFTSSSSNWSGSTSGALAYTVNGASPGLALTIPTHVYGDSFTLAATSNSPGAITSSIVSGYTATGAISGTTFTAIATGTGGVTVTQAASGNYAAATINVFFTITPQTPTTNVSPTTWTYGAASQTLTGTISWTGAVAAPSLTGNNFLVDGSSPGPATCTGTTSPVTCTFTYAASNTLAAGTHTLALSTNGGGNFLTASRVNGSITVVNNTPSINVTSPTINYATTSTTLTASIPYTGSVAPAGAVTFSLNGGANVTATCTTGSSPRTCTVSVPTGTLLPGNYSIFVSEAASTDYNTSTGSGTLTVNQITPTVASAPFPPQITYGTPDAILSVSFGYTGPAPTGSVVFNIHTTAGYRFTPTATCTAASNVLSCTYDYQTATLPFGAYDFNATLAADANYVSVSSPLRTLAIQGAQPTLTVTGGTIAFGTATDTLTAMLSYPGSGNPPSSPVIFSVDGGGGSAGTCAGTSSPLICTLTINSSGLAAGTHGINVSYATDYNYYSASGSGSFTVTQLPTTTSLTSTSSTAGSSVVLTSNIGGLPAGYNGGTVTFYDNGTAICSAVSVANSTATCTSPQLLSGSNSFTAIFSGDGGYASSTGGPVVISVDPASNTGTGSTAPGATSAPISIPITFTSSFTLGSTGVTNYGSTGNAFTITGTTCVAGTTYGAGQSCTVTYTYTNVAPGLLTGLILITDNSGNVVAELPLAVLGAR